MGKKSFQKEIGSLMNQTINQTLSKMISGDKPKQETPKEKRPVGRPRKKSSTCQNGLPEGETRMTFLVSEVHQDKLKYISYRERLSLKQIMSEAIQNYLNDYESIYGEIDLNA
jgi:hypothetical protein